jgi:tetratricopeptide (TPR) repeat protein
MDGTLTLKCFDISKGIITTLLTNTIGYYDIKTIKNTNIIFFIKNISKSPYEDNGRIVYYDIDKIMFYDLTVPYKGEYIDDWNIDYSVSPNANILIYMGDVIDLKRNIIFDILMLTNMLSSNYYEESPKYFRWKLDSSSVIFRCSKMFKYTLPKKYWDVNRNSTSGVGGNNFESLQREGYAFYLKHQDAEAVKKYEEALKLGESAELWYDYANSLSNLKDRLTDSLTAYQKAIDLGFDKKTLAFYNLACVYSRLGKIPEAYQSLGKALESGYQSYDHVESDSDLENLRMDKDWKAKWAEMRKER